MFGASRSRLWKIDVTMGRNQEIDQKAIEALLIALDGALKKTQKDRARICHLGREILKAAIVSRTADLWASIEQKAVRLLERAAEATQDSPYEDNCMGRADALRDAIARLRDVEDAWSALRESVKQPS